MNKTSIDNSEDKELVKELINQDKLAGLLTTTLSAFTKVGQIDAELLFYVKDAIAWTITIFPDEEIAFQIALDAALNVKHIANEREHYRRYYTSAKKTKILLSRVQLFQQMLSYELQKWEIYQENAYLLQCLQGYSQEQNIEYQIKDGIEAEHLTQSLEASEIHCDPRLVKLVTLLTNLTFSANDMLIRYLEFLIRSSLDGNSSHVVLVVNNLIYGYTLSNVRDLCAFINPDSVSSQYLYTLRAKLIAKIKERFNGFIIYTGEGVNEQFELQTDSNENLIKTVNNWLGILTPWRTECVSNKAKSTDELVGKSLFNWLESLGSKDQRELSCSHMLICPRCYEKLLLVYSKNNSHNSEWKTNKPAIPKFYIPNKQVNRQLPIPKMKDTSTNLNVKNLANRILESLNQESKHSTSKVHLLKTLFVFVDGKKKATLDLDKANSVLLNLDRDSKLVKVMAQDNEGLVLLGALLLRHNEIEGSLSYRLLGWKKYSIALEGLGRIVFALSLSESEGEESFIINISCYKNYYQSYTNHLLNLHKMSLVMLYQPANIRIVSIIVFISIVGIYTYYSLFRPTIPQSNLPSIEKVKHLEIANLKKDNDDKYDDLNNKHDESQSKVPSDYTRSTKADIHPSKVSRNSRKGEQSNKPKEQIPVFDIRMKVNPEEFAKNRDNTKGGIKTVIHKNKSKTEPQEIEMEKEVASLGFTLWRFRKSEIDDEHEERLPTIEGIENLTPERVEGNPLKIEDGAKVRFSVEMPVEGYLYVFNREQYADGSYSSPYLVYPIKGVNKLEDNNRIEISQPIYLPRQQKDYYFIVDSEKGKILAEVYTFLVSPSPLGLSAIECKEIGGSTKGEPNVNCPPREVKKEEFDFETKLKEWSNNTEVSELDLKDPKHNEYKTMSKAEIKSLKNKANKLTVKDPPPQKVYTIARKPTEPYMVSIPIYINTKQ